MREDEVRLLERCCTAKGVLFQGEAQRRPGRAASVARARDAVSVVDRMRGLPYGLSPQKTKAGDGRVVLREARGRGHGESGPRPLERLLRVAREEMGLKVTVVGGEDGLAPESLLDDAARRAARDAQEAFAKALGALKDAPSTVAAFRHDGVAFADLAAAADLEALLGGPAARRRCGGRKACAPCCGRARPGRCAPRADDALALHAGGLAGVPVVALRRRGGRPRVLHALEAAARGAGMVG